MTDGNQKIDVAAIVGVHTGRRFKVRVGRGSGSGLGKTSGRGSKGAASRTGFGGLLWREGGQMPLIRRLPKRGFRNAMFRVAYEVVNVDRLDACGKSEVTPDTLKDAGFLPRSAERVKILGNGEVKTKLAVSAHAFSAEARKKIEAAGGTATVIEIKSGVGPKTRSRGKLAKGQTRSAPKHAKKEPSRKA